MSEQKQSGEELKARHSARIIKQLLRLSKTADS